MQKITPFLWFDKQAEEAAKFYTTLFKNGSIGTITHYPEGMEDVSGMPASSVMTVGFNIDGTEFGAMNAWPTFKTNPSVSFYVTCQTAEELDKYREALSEGGKVLMELGKYDWSEKYGWVEDKFGVSWQLFIGQEAKPIRPCMMFANAVQGRAQEAMDLYISVFKNSKIVFSAPYEAPQQWVMHAVFMLDGQELIAMDSPVKHDFDFSEGISFVINCDGQEEVDHFWNALIADGGQESQCGWLKDKFGFSWQVVPKQMYNYVGGPDTLGSQRATQAMLQMKKLDLSLLKKAYDGENA